MSFKALSATALLVGSAAACPSAFAQAALFSVHLRLLGGAGFCTNADEFSEADTRRIATRPAISLEAVGEYRLPGTRFSLSSGLGINRWRYDVRLREELRAGISYEDSRQGPGGNSFSVPVRAGFRVSNALRLEAGFVYLRHVGRAPVANAAYNFRSGATVLRGEAKNYAQRFSNQLLDLSVNYEASRHISIHARGAAGLQAFPGVQIIENLATGNNVTLYRTQGAARLAFVFAGVGYVF